MISTTAAAQEACPAALDVPANSASLMAQIKAAADAQSAKTLTNLMFEKYWTMAPDARAQSLLDAGMSKRAGYDYAGAAEDLDALIAYCPDYAEGYNQRAFVAYLRGNYGSAVSFLETAIEINPQHFAALAGLAVSLIYQGRMEAGQNVLRDALSFNPWLPEQGFLTEPLDTEL